MDANDSDALNALMSLEEAEELAAEGAEAFWETFQYLQEDLEFENEELIASAVLEIQRFCRVVGFTKRDMASVFREALKVYDELEPPDGVLRGEEAEVAALDIIGKPKDKKPWMK